MSEQDSSNNETRSGGGCLGRLCGACFWIIVISLVINHCSGGKEYTPPPPPEKYDVTISLDYQKIMDFQLGFIASNIPMNVYVDNEKLGTQEAGTVQSYKLSLEEGKHKFYLKNDGTYKTDVISFEVSPANRSFSFGAKTRMTFGVEVWTND